MDAQQVGRRDPGRNEHFEFDFTLGKNKPDAWISSMDGSLLQLTNYEQPST